MSRPAITLANNQSAISPFRASIEEAGLSSRPARKARQDIGKVLKVPPRAVANLLVPAIDANEQLSFWIDVVKKQKQNMLRARSTRRS
jgi:hypothetical protein